MEEQMQTSGEIDGSGDRTRSGRIGEEEVHCSDEVAEIGLPGQPVLEPGEELSVRDRLGLRWEPRQ